MTITTEQIPSNSGNEQATSPPENQTVTVVPDPPKSRELVIPASAMKEIKEKERQKGAKIAQAEAAAKADQDAQALGFTDYADMITKLKDPPKTEPKDDTVSETLKAELEQLRAEKAASDARASAAEAERERVRAEAEAEVGRVKILAAAQKAGVVDPELGIVKLQQAQLGLTPEQLQSFDVTKFFDEDLRKTAPYLYPTTATTTAPVVQAPAPNSTTTAPQSRSAYELTKDEFHAKLRELGIRSPT
jgi:hypothetical protein